MIIHNSVFSCPPGLKCDQCNGCNKTELKDIEKSICVICAEKDACLYDMKEDTVACHRFRKEEENHAGQEQEL